MEPSIRSPRACPAYRDANLLTPSSRRLIIPITTSLVCRLLLFNNVIVTGHQAFLTEEALSAIAAVTISNIDMVLAAAAEGKAIAAGPTVVHAA